MKTYDEICVALRIVAEEAHKSGFTLCAAIAPPQISKPVDSVHCGESLKIIALAEVIKANVFSVNNSTKVN